MKKYLVYFIGVFVLVAIGSMWLTDRIMSDTPPFILSRLEELKSNKTLMDSIGGFRLFEYSYNEQNFKNGDTVKYSITITGGKDDLVYKGIQIKNSLNSWVLVTDTLIIQ